MENMTAGQKSKAGLDARTLWFVQGALVLVAVLCCLSLSAVSWAAGAGKSSANFLKMGVGGRGAAMGDAHTAAVEDVDALYWNPAALGLLRQNEVGFMRNNSYQSIDQSVLFYAHPTETRGTFGAGISMLRVGDIAGYDASDNATGDLSASDTLLTFAWGRPWDGLPLLPGVQTGMSVKLLQKKLAQDSATAYMADLGLLYEAKEGIFQRLKTGFAIQNIGSGIQFASEKSSLPMSLKLGWAYPFFGDNLTTALDVVSPTDGKAYFNMGADYKLWDIVAFRLGYRGRHDLDTGVTYGLRLGNERLHLDYAFVPFGALGDTHRLSLGFRFGKAFRQAQVQTQIKQAYERAEARYAQGYLVEAYIQASQIMDVAPWHRPSRNLMRKIESDFKQLEDQARKEQLQNQIDDHFTRGEQAFQLDDLMAARREFQAILALQPDNAATKTYLKRIDERFRSIVQSFYETAMRDFASGDYKGAKEFLEKVLVVEPDNAEAREQLSRTDMLLSQAEKAEEERMKQEAARPLYNAGLDLFKSKKYEEALRKFEDLMALDSENAEAKRYRALCRDLVAKEAYDQGNAAARDGDWSRAAELFKKALKLKPDFAEAQKALDKVRSHLGEQKKGESQELYRKGLEAFLSGDQDKALEFWQKAVEMDPENLEAKRGVERILQKRGAPAAQ
jgi:tetratricopeptide (TPR) repeat protein